ncbi:MAG: transglycosylase domain-containing protein [Buchnera aphidicola (Nurudea yanoniella)]
MYKMNIKFNSIVVSKIFFSLFFLIMLYGFFLYIKINSFINKKTWSFPILIYSRIITLEPGNYYSQKEMVSILKSIQYKYVSILKRSGEFITKGENIILIRRSFIFPDEKEGKIYAKLYFNKNRLTKIENLYNNHNFGLLRLDPKLITILPSSYEKQRLFLPLKCYPSELINILLATEDKHFYNHSGINIHSIIRAFLTNIHAGYIVQGGSTLTQQLVKNLFLTNSRTLWRKINEICMALILDWKYSKDKILELYLNEVYLGQNGNKQIRGLPLASLHYFGRPMNELSFDQYALLVGMIKGASLYNPWKNPSITLNRRNVVLYVLHKQNIISNKLYRYLILRPLGVQSQDSIISEKSLFMQIVKKEIKQKLKHKIKNFSGIKVFTTLDLISHIFSENVMKSSISLLKREKNIKNLDMSMVIIDKVNGGIQGILESSHNKILNNDHVSQIHYSVGSLFEFITCLFTFIQFNTFSIDEFISDRFIISRFNSEQFFQFKNSSSIEFKREEGFIDRLVFFINFPKKNLNAQLEIKKLLEIFIKLGFLDNQTLKNPYISLGMINLTPIKVAQVLQVIASRGYKSNMSFIQTIISKDNIVLYNILPQFNWVMSMQNVYSILFSMQSVIKFCKIEKLGKLFKNDFLNNIVKKKDDFVDRWFVSIDKKKIIVIWIGRDNHKYCELHQCSNSMKSYFHNLRF